MSPCGAILHVVLCVTPSHVELLPDHCEHLPDHPVWSVTTVGLAVTTVAFDFASRWGSSIE